MQNLLSSRYDLHVDIAIPLLLMEEGGLVEYVCTHPCFVDVFLVETMKSPCMEAIRATTYFPTVTCRSLGLRFIFCCLDSGLRPFDVRPVRADLYHSDVRM